MSADDEAPAHPESPILDAGADWADMVLVGRIGRTHGLRGHVFVTPETDFVEERFAPGAGVWVQTAQGVRQLTIAAARVQGGRPIVQFAGVERIEDAEPLAGLELRVPERDLQPLEPGTFYQHQLVGCVVETTTGERVGEVVRVDGGAAGSLLVIQGPRGEILIPLAADICVGIDTAAQRIRVAPPEGLLELNEPTRSRG